MDCNSPNAHLDFLSTPLLVTNSGQQVVQELQDYVKVHSACSVITLFVLRKLRQRLFEG